MEKLNIKIMGGNTLHSLGLIEHPRLEEYSIWGVVIKDKNDKWILATACFGPMSLISALAAVRMFVDAHEGRGDTSPVEAMEYAWKEGD